MTLHLGVVGLGNISDRHRKNLKYLYPKATVIAISASGKTPTDKIENSDKVTDGIKSLINEQPDLVIVASPASLHSTHAIPLIKAGIPVLIEKPVTATLADAAQLLQVSNSYKTPVAVGYCLRYLSSAIAIKKLIENKTIGTIYNASVNIGQFLPDWRPNKDYKDTVSANSKLGGGALLELSHELDYLQWLLGELDFKYAHLRNSTELQLDVEELADIVLMSKSGCVCNVHMDFIQKKAQRKCSFIGSQGRLDWDLLNNSIILHNKHGSKTLFSRPDQDKNKMYLDMLADFEHLRQERPNKCPTLAEAYQTVFLIDEIKQRATWGGTL